MASCQARAVNPSRVDGGGGAGVGGDLPVGQIP